MALGVQLVLVALSWWPGDRSATRARPVFDLQRDDIREIEIATRPQGDAAPDPVVLVRDDDGWTVRSAAGYPATPDRIDDLVDALLGLTTAGPIATQAAGHKALKVSDDSYGRRVRVVADGEPVEWLIGAATSRSINMRRVGEDDVYRARGASEWSFRDQASSYYDATYVDADPDTFEAVALHNEHGDLRFEGGTAGWTLADLAEGELADPEKIHGFLSVVAKLRMSEPVGRKSSLYAMKLPTPSYNSSAASNGGLVRSIRTSTSAANVRLHRSP